MLGEAPGAQLGDQFVAIDIGDEDQLFAGAGEGDIEDTQLFRQEAAFDVIGGEVVAEGVPGIAGKRIDNA